MDVDSVTTCTSSLAALEFGVDIRDVLDAAEVRADTFDDPENPIAHADLGRLLLECERRTHCDYISLLLAA